MTIGSRSSTDRYFDIRVGNINATRTPAIVKISFIVAK